MALWNYGTIVLLPRACLSRIPDYEFDACDKDSINLNSNTNFSFSEREFFQCPSKTEYLIIGHPRKTKDVNIPNGLKLNDSEIKRVSKTKSLGVMVDENLKWDEQFKTVKNKICGGLASLKKLKNILPQSKLCSVYYAIVESHLRYADVIWGSLPTRKLETLQRLQNRAQSIIENARLKDNWSCD